MTTLLTEERRHFGLECRIRQERELDAMKGFLGLMDEGIAFIVDIWVLDFRWIRHDCCRLAWIRRCSPVWGFRTLFTFAAIGRPAFWGNAIPLLPVAKFVWGI